jgi:hypothetical protein
VAVHVVVDHLCLNFLFIKYNCLLDVIHALKKYSIVIYLIVTASLSQITLVTL